MDTDKLLKRKDYTRDDKEISRADGWADFLHDWPRLFWAIYLPFHIAIGQFVNVWRILGIKSKEGSQFMGRGTFWMLLAVFALTMIDKYI